MGYFKELTSPSCKWLVSLHINVMQVSRPDLVALGTIPNLLVLGLFQDYIRPYANRFDERVLLSWVEMIRVTGSTAFKSLRVLELTGLKSLGLDVFHYLECFPSICSIIVTEHDPFTSSQREHWRSMAHKSGFKERHVTMSDKFNCTYVNSILRETRDIHASLATSNHDPSICEGFPIAEFEIGCDEPGKNPFRRFEDWRDFTMWFDSARDKSWKSPEPEVTIHDPPGKQTLKRNRKRCRSDPTHKAQIAPPDGREGTEEVFHPQPNAAAFGNHPTEPKGATSIPLATDCRQRKIDEQESTNTTSRDDDFDPVDTEEPTCKRVLRRRPAGQGHMKDLNGVLAELGGVSRPDKRRDT